MFFLLSAFRGGQAMDSRASIKEQSEEETGITQLSDSINCERAPVTLPTLPYLDERRLLNSFLSAAAY